MRKEFIPYEQALELKELGFDEPCLAFYDGKNTESFYFNNTRDASGDYIPFQKHDRLKWFGAPLYQQAFRWFREKHGLKISFPYWNGFNKMIPEDLGRDKYEIMIIPNNHRTISVRNPKGRIWFDTYEEAELACLKKLIEIVKGGNK